MVLHQLASDAEDLERKLSGGGHDDDAGTVSGLESERAEDFDGGNQEGERLSGSSLGCTEDVLASEKRWDGLLRSSVSISMSTDVIGAENLKRKTNTALDASHLCEAHLLNCPHGFFSQLEILKLVRLGQGR